MAHLCVIVARRLRMNVRSCCCLNVQEAASPLTVVATSAPRSLMGPSSTRTSRMAMMPGVYSRQAEARDAGQPENVAL